MNSNFIAVIGHRNLSQPIEEKVRKALKYKLSELKSENVKVLTGLALGVDQIAAEICLELSIPYEVVLPMPEDEFFNKSIAQDLDTKQQKKAKNKFEILLSKAEAIHQIYEEEWFKDAIKNSISASKPYELLGDYLCDISQQCIFVWDGVQNGKPGGTSDTLAKAMQKKDLIKWELKLFNEISGQTDQSEFYKWEKFL
ncbi:MAG: hypothetical protein HWE07_13925 [Cytophagia bacterium]|nr:hypothetical protein [Cytophagia bacterium]